MTFLVYPLLGSLAGWFLLVAVLAVKTRNPPVTAAPELAEFGPESPAVVDLITGGWRLCDEAASATVLDLAARGEIEIEEVGPELSLVRLRGGSGGGDHGTLPNPYEHMVYTRLYRLAGSDGVVAAGALAEGNRRSRSWWRGFRRGVVREARDLGLSRARFTRFQVGLVGSTMLIPLLLLALILEGELGVLSAIGLAALLTGVLKLVNGERGTAEGARVAGLWLGTRDHLRSGRFGDKPAAAVTIYGRPFAYAAALGLAHQAVAGLPIGREADERRAWSDRGGFWHPVRVRYPGLLPGIRRVPLLWGRRPGPVLGVTAAIAVPLLAVIWLLSEGPLALALTAAWLAAAAVPVVRSVLDLGSRKVIEGQVVRLRHYAQTLRRTPKHTYWLAVDEGQRTTVTACMVPFDLYHRQVNEGDEVRLTVGRGLGWIYDLQILSRGNRPIPDDDSPIPDHEMPESLGEMG